MIISKDFEEAQYFSMQIKIFNLFQVDRQNVIISAWHDLPSYPREESTLREKGARRHNL